MLQQIIHFDFRYSVDHGAYFLQVPTERDQAIQNINGLPFEAPCKLMARLQGRLVSVRAARSPHLLFCTIY